MSEEVIRQELVALLKGGNAHMDIPAAVLEFPLDAINVLYPNGEYSAWCVLEHIRRTQFDILDFIRNPDYKEPKWPHDYWPEKGTQATPAQWDATLQGIYEDLKALEDIVEDPKTDLYAKIPWGDGQNILREILVVADHNSHHLGEFAIMRQTMNTWGPDKPY